ncbi:hypothetical protein [Streptomyces sp. ISL-11]|uniref:hypothetical protein n=1 Tax=Streptomyces sp. ISL-11 TaxID=2819174 RepID=UPI001BECC99E|nr:hypothetical protein [Streptomyces sp. ISL-11]MBT2384376.1 hypothetical protein [Streptomyces sp. ISL-11]
MTLLSTGRIWLRGVAALSLVLAVSLGAVPPSTADDGRPAGAADGTDLTKKYKGENPLTLPVLLPVLELRMELGRALGEERAYKAFDQYRNGASDLIDPRRLTEQQLKALLKTNVNKSGSPVWRGSMVDLGAVGTFLNRKDLAELKKADVSSVLALSALNDPGGAHSEGVIQNLLDEEGVAKESKLAGSSERQQCWECANFYHPEKPTYFAAPFDINRSELASLDKSIVVAEKKAKALGLDAKETTRRINKLVDTYWAQTKAKNKEAGAQLDKHLVAAWKQAQKSAGKTNKELGSVLSAEPSCPRKQHPDAPGAPAHNFMRPVAAVSDPCDKQQPSAESKPATGLSQALATPGAAPGGIDFSSLQLRYLSDPGDGSGLQYSFSAQRDPVKGDSRTSTGLVAANQTSDAFFALLSLNPSAFWVNLNPDEPNRIVDPELGRTDAGRIMLQADLQMKKSIGKFIHPDTELGRKFWEGVSADCMSYRTWILPAPATVRQDGDKLYIVDAPIDVKMETQYLNQRGRATASSCPQQDKATEQRNEQLYRSLILPKLKHAINNAPEYAELRRVYLARVAVEWYRELSRTKHTTYGDLIGKGDIEKWRTKTAWKPTETFDQYVDSYKNGEFNVTHKTTSGNTIYTRTYIYGGVDLTRIPFEKVSDDRFRKEHAGLSKNIDASLTEPAAGDGGDAVWLGAPTPRQAAGGSAAEAGWSVGDMSLRLLPALLLPMAALLWWRRRRLSASATASPLRRAAVPHSRTRHDDRRS